MWHREASSFGRKKEECGTERPPSSPVSLLDDPSYVTDSHINVRNVGRTGARAGVYGTAGPRWFIPVSLLVRVESPCFSPFYTFLTVVRKVALNPVYTPQTGPGITGINSGITGINDRKRPPPPCIALGSRESSTFLTFLVIPVLFPLWDPF